jgi:hypothetical protein
MMATEMLETPVDEATGLPYCFAPYDGLAPVARNGENLARLGDWNHQFPRYEVKCSENPALDQLGKQALIGSRVQWVDFSQHHDLYNNLFVGPRQPQTREALACTLVMAEAGFIPDVAIDLSRSQPREMAVSPEQRRYLWESGQVRVWDTVSVRKWLFRYVFEQEVDHIRPSKLDEFLHTPDLQHRIQLGHTLAAKIVERAVEPIDGVYSAARKQGLLAASNTTHVRDFVKPRLTAGASFGLVFNELHKKLGAYNRSLKEQELAAA